MNSDMVTPAGSLCPGIGLTPAAVTNPTVQVNSLVTCHLHTLHVASTCYGVSNLASCPNSNKQ